MHRRIHVGEVPLVGGHLPVGVGVPFAQEQDQLVLAELRIDSGEGRGVEGEIPGAVVGILPGIGHREDVAVEEMHPVRIARGMTSGGRGFGSVTAGPLALDEIIELLAPEQTRIGLACHKLLLRVEGGINGRRVELFGLVETHRKDLRMVLAKRIDRGIAPLSLCGEAQADFHAFSRRNGEIVAGGDLGSGHGRIHRIGLAVDHRVMEGILGVFLPRG